MSGEHLARVRQEPDRIRGVVVFLIIMVAIGFALACVGASWLIWRANISAFRAAGPLRRGEVEVMPAAIWGVNQTLIDVDAEGQRLNADGLRRLDSHRWIDEEEGVAQIPIREAMRAIVAGGEIR